MVDSGMDNDDEARRIQALERFIDWAEREAAELKAGQARTCLQLARAALQMPRGDQLPV